MGTKFSDIYSQNQILSDDIRLAGMTEPEKYKLFFEYLKYAISFRSFFRDCNQDIRAYTPYSGITYTFPVDGADYQFQLTPQPPASPNFYIYYDMDETTKEIVTDYSFNSATNVLTVNDPQNIGVNLIVSAYTIGEFEEVLDDDVIEILAGGMLIPYLSYFKNKTQNLVQRFVGAEVKFYSQNLFKEQMREDLKHQISFVKGLISKYSYSASTDELNGLGGGLYNDSTS